MIFKGLKKVVAASVLTAVLLNPAHLMAQDSGVLDESIEDLYIVLGTGAAGAILGLSTLSFADKPKDHLKNISIGGAIGIVIGVGIAVFSQASKSTAAIVHDKSSDSPATASDIESLNRLEFAQERVAKNYLPTPSFGFSFEF